MAGRIRGPRLAISFAMLAAGASATGAVLPTTTTAAADPRAGAVRIDDAEPAGGPRFEVGELVLTFTDRSRRVRYPGARAAVPRTLETIIRYPAAGDPARFDVFGAPPAKTAGPFPLIVFGHGFDTTPTPYARLLRAWARAGYVVAAPIFPLGNANAPGGANERDLVNQPADMSFIISRMLAASNARRGALSGLIDSHEVAVSGQSDGGSTALAAAYNRNYVDRRIRAAMILSGAEIPGVGGYDFPSPSPPLLASQGTADDVNAPASTYHFFGIAPRPRLLLSLLGAAHLGPYTSEEPQLGIVERVTVAFLDRYLKRRRAAGWRMWTVGDVPRLATLRTTL